MYYVSVLRLFSKIDNFYFYFIFLPWESRGGGRKVSVMVMFFFLCFYDDIFVNKYFMGDREVMAVTKYFVLGYIVYLIVRVNN